MSLILVAGWIALLVFIGTRSEDSLEFYLLMGWIGILVIGGLAVAWKAFA